METIDTIDNILTPTLNSNTLDNAIRKVYFSRMNNDVFGNIQTIDYGTFCYSKCEPVNSNKSLELILKTIGHQS